MSEGLNRVMLLGNLGADPELKMTQGGQAVLKLRLATSSSFMGKDNVRQERTEWHSCSLWGKRAEALAKFLVKGDRILVEGSLRTSSYEKNGEKRHSTEINVDNVILNGKAGGGQRQNDNNDSAPASRAPASAADDFGDYANGGDGDDSEIPF